MLKNVVVATLVAGILGVGSAALAADLQDFTKGKEKITRNGVEFWVELNSPMKQDILNGKYDKIAQEFSKETSENQKQTRATNPTLSKVHIFQVESSQGGLEDITYRQGTTQKDHGGSLFKVRTLVNGFGCIADTAQFNKQFVKQSYSSFIVGVGNRATGCIDERDLSGQLQSDNFIFTAKNSAGTQYPKQIIESLLIK